MARVNDPKKLPITNFQKALIDNYYSNGFDRYQAYADVKGEKVSKDKKKRSSISAMVNHALNNNPDYVAKVEAKNDKKYGKMKDRLVAKLEGVADAFEELTNMALTDGKLSEDDEAKFRRLKAIMTAKDYNKAVELIGKLTGSFEAEKVDVTQTFTLDWGGPSLEETNKDVIDTDYEELDDE